MSSFLKPNYVYMRSLDFGEGSKDRKLVNLSRKSLGDFLYHALRCGAEINHIWPLNPNYDRSYVGIALSIHEDRIKEFEEKSGFGLEEPYKIKVN